MSTLYHSVVGKTIEPLPPTMSGGLSIRARRVARDGTEIDGCNGEFRQKRRRRGEANGSLVGAKGDESNIKACGFQGNIYIYIYACRIMHVAT